MASSVIQMPLPQAQRALLTPASIAEYAAHRAHEVAADLLVAAHECRTHDEIAAVRRILEALVVEFLAAQDSAADFADRLSEKD